MNTTKNVSFGKGTVVVPSDGNGAVRRLEITCDKLVTQPFEGIDVLPDVIAYAARYHGNRDAVGWRNIMKLHEEEKQVKKMVSGKEVTEIKKWKYLELSEFQYMGFLDVQTRISELARGLLHHDITKDDVFNIYAQTSVNWQLMSHACTTIATTVATAYDTLGEAGLAHSLNEPDCVGIFTNAELLPTLARVIKDTPSVRLVVYDGEAKSTSLDQIRNTRDDIIVTSLDELRTLGKAQPIEILEARKPTPDDRAMIMYTSGSTGAPKGVVLTHGNVVASIGGIYRLLGHHLRHDDTFLAYLPLAHILEYVVEITLYLCGMKTGYGRVKTLTDTSVRNCKGDIAELRPTILVGVPQFWEMIRKYALVNWVRRKYVFNSAIAFKKAVPALGDVMDAAMLGSVKAAMGGRLRLAMSGGAALSSETQEFLSLALVTVLQGYGMTESCAMCTVLPPELMQYGAVGLPSPCIEIKLIDVPAAGYLAAANPPRGEICIRGPAVTKGYYKRDDLNNDKTIFTEDGWLRTGDVGQCNPDGTFSVIGRIEHLVKLQGGEYIALERLEATYRSCNLVSNICVYASAGTEQPIGIIIPHEINLRHAVQQKSLPGVDASASLSHLCHEKAVQELVLKECNLVGRNNDFKSVEMLEAVILSAEEWTPENGLVTAIQKVQRNKIVKFFEQEIKVTSKNSDIAIHLGRENTVSDTDDIRGGYSAERTTNRRAQDEQPTKNATIILEKAVQELKNQLAVLQAHHEVQSRELVSVQQELKAVKSSNEAKDRTIAARTAEVDRWKRSDATKAEELIAVRKELGSVRGELVTAREELDSVREELFSAREELVSVNKELQFSQSQTITVQEWYSEQFRQLKLIAEASQRTLFPVQSFIAQADVRAGMNIIETVQRLNESIQWSSTFIADRAIHNFQPRTTNPTEDQLSAVKRVTDSIGQPLVNQLRRNSRTDVAEYLPIALRAYLVYHLCDIISSWSIDVNGPNRFIRELYNVVRKLESQTVSGRWRSLTYASISPTCSSNPSTFVVPVIDGLSDIVAAAGCAPSASAAKEMIVSKSRHRIPFILTTAGQLTKSIMDALAADYRVNVIRPAEMLDEGTAEVGPVGQGRRSRSQRVLCTTQLGLSKEVTQSKVGPNKKNTVMTTNVVKVKVLLV